VVPAVVGGVLAVAAVAVIASGPGDSRSARPGARAASRPRAALGYDFDRDGRLELVASVVGARLRGSHRRAGVVLVRRRNHWTAISEKDAGMPGPEGNGDQFGSGMASGDFDRDGAADLAIGAPGRNRVSVLLGTGRRALSWRRRVQLTGPHRYGQNLLADDFNGDGYDDLLATAPGTGTEHGAMRLLFGGPDGVSATRSRLLPRPAAAAARFGSRVRAADVDGDHHLDLIEGGPAQRLIPGHGCFCRGSRSGPHRCRAFGGTDATTGLAVADFNHDGYADIAQGDAGHALAGLPVGGVVRLWLGGRHGPRPAPIVISQNTPAIPGDDEPGDQFGAGIDAGDVDTDGFPDMIVAAPGENDNAGRVTVIRGGHRGYATAANTWFDQNSPNVPGSRRPGGLFGSTLAVLDLTGDHRPDLVVGARGERRANARLMVVEAGPGVFAPDETRTKILSGTTARVVMPPRGRIRLARVSHF
jgi:hypothetical protein